jgi:hypothetical protein
MNLTSLGLRCEVTGAHQRTEALYHGGAWGSGVPRKDSA